jgi:N-acetylglutamate synthase-like GNAT family acetyltransferase
MDVIYRTQGATINNVQEHLKNCDSTFKPTLSSRLNINEYAEKIVDKAQTFEAWSKGKLIALVAIYCNTPDNLTAYITSVSVIPECQNKGLANQLLQMSLYSVKKLGFKKVELEVHPNNKAAIGLYSKHGFAILENKGIMQKMIVNLTKESKLEKTRDFNAETRDTSDHQYAYRFDFDVMHPFMIRSFEPFFQPGCFLELGSFKGAFTRRFLELFDDVTCVEASEEAITEAKAKLGNKPKFIHSLFETASLPKRYENIVMTHVLEHVEDPIRVLARINNEWLTEGGRLFLVCPNANAPSRQIAVKMGLISHNTALTPAEIEHGHRVTYTLDTLERDAVAAGLKVVYRSGIFFKALANFQWDRLLQTDIISKEYLEGCYKIGQNYPELCSSIFLLCEKGSNNKLS